MTRELVLGTRPEYRAAIAATVPLTPTAPTPPSMRRELRYSGTLDNVIVEVWSPGGPTIEKAGERMVITVGASVESRSIRISATDPERKSSPAMFPSKSPRKATHCRGPGTSGDQSSCFRMLVVQCIFFGITTPVNHYGQAISRNEPLLGLS
jgi:hypothetical protein